ncbi:zinc finger Y-chromosomal protein isoform X3 [Halyomorpha halys]|nr:zinc finger protein 64-like isoform X4 [Halyomorpha halys]XP_014272117.1 zinc finger protein 64-like isoform X4 [Halyomorpha halys]
MDNIGIKLEMKQEVDDEFSAISGFNEQENTVNSSMLTDSKDQKVSCYHCSLGFSRIKNLRLHIQRKHLQHLRKQKNQPCLWKTKQCEGKYQCVLCDYRTSIHCNLTRHQLALHSYKAYQCFLCDYKAGRSDLLKIHNLRHHTNRRPFQCLYCDFRTVEARNLKRHMNNKHKPISKNPKGKKRSKLKTFECLLCDYKATYISDVYRHMSSKHGEKQYQCTLCNYKTGYNINLKRHLTACHSNDRPYKCKFCHFKTAIPSHLRRHLRGKKHKALFN